MRGFSVTSLAGIYIKDSFFSELLGSAEEKNVDFVNAAVCESRDLGV